MNQNQYDSIEKTLTNIRLQSYICKTKEDTISNYLNNIEICRSFYPLLHFFEVSLRNAIDKVFSDYVNGKEWFDILRNRISHCEQINIFKNLTALHTELLESIGWIESEIKNLACKMDNIQVSLNFKVKL